MALMSSYIGHCYAVWLPFGTVVAWLSTFNFRLSSGCPDGNVVTVNVAAVMFTDLMVLVLLDGCCSLNVTDLTTCP